VVFSFRESCLYRKKIASKYPHFERVLIVTAAVIWVTHSMSQRSFQMSLTVTMNLNELVKDLLDAIGTAQGLLRV
jgi:hypothetical protein